MGDVVGLGMVGILGAVLVAGVPAQSAIDVSPGSGTAGTSVTITQTEFDPVEGPCIIASATLGGEGVDTSSGVPGVATFVVPESRAVGRPDRHRHLRGWCVRRLGAVHRDR